MLIVIWFVLGVLFFLATITVLHLVRPILSKKSIQAEESDPRFV